MPEPKSHLSNRPLLERIVHFIPGFKGYLDRDNRREADALQRHFLAERLQRSKRGIDGASRQWVDAGLLDRLPACDRLRAQLDKLIGRIQGAMQGYSGVFDLVQIDERLLDRVYDFDLKLVEKVEHLADQIEKLPAASPDTTAAVALGPITAEVAAVEQLWDQRAEILKGVD